MLLTIKDVNKDIKSTKNIFADNHVHNILRIFDDWASFSFTISETKHNN